MKDKHGALINPLSTSRKFDANTPHSAATQFLMKRKGEEFQSGDLVFAEFDSYSWPALVTTVGTRTLEVVTLVLEQDELIDKDRVVLFQGQEQLNRIMSVLTPGEQQDFSEASTSLMELSRKTRAERLNFVKMERAGILSEGSEEGGSSKENAGENEGSDADCLPHSNGEKQTKKLSCDVDDISLAPVRNHLEQIINTPNSEYNIDLPVEQVLANYPLTSGPDLDSEESEIEVRLSLTPSFNGHQENGNKIASSKRKKMHLKQKRDEDFIAKSVQETNEMIKNVESFPGQLSYDSLKIARERAQMIAGCVGPVSETRRRRSKSRSKDETPVTPPFPAPEVIEKAHIDHLKATREAQKKALMSHENKLELTIATDLNIIGSPEKTSQTARRKSSSKGTPKKTPDKSPKKESARPPEIVVEIPAKKTPRKSRSPKVPKDKNAEKAIKKSTHDKRLAALKLARDKKSAMARERKEKAAQTLLPKAETLVIPVECTTALTEMVGSTDVSFQDPIVETDTNSQETDTNSQEPDSSSPDLNSSQEDNSAENDASSQDAETIEPSTSKTEPTTDPLIPEIGTNIEEIPEKDDYIVDVINFLSPYYLNLFSSLIKEQIESQIKLDLEKLPAAEIGIILKLVVEKTTRHVKKQAYEIISKLVKNSPCQKLLKPKEEQLPEVGPGTPPASPKQESRVANKIMPVARHKAKAVAQDVLHNPFPVSMVDVTEKTKKYYLESRSLKKDHAVIPKQWRHYMKSQGRFSTSQQQQHTTEESPQQRKGIDTPPSNKRRKLDPAKPKKRVKVEEPSIEDLMNKKLALSFYVQDLQLQMTEPLKLKAGDVKWDELGSDIQLKYMSLCEKMSVLSGENQRIECLGLDLYCKSTADVSRLDWSSLPPTKQKKFLRDAKKMKNKDLDDLQEIAEHNEDLVTKLVDADSKKRKSSSKVSDDSGEKKERGDGNTVLDYICMDCFTLGDYVLQAMLPIVIIISIDGTYNQLVN